MSNYFDNNDDSRDGYKSKSENNGGHTGSERPVGRQRFSRSYTPVNGNGGYNRNEGEVRPRFNRDNSRSSYGSEGGYQSRQQGNYRPRYNQGVGDGGQRSENRWGKPLYSNNGDNGGYHSRPQNGGGYRPRYNQGGNEGGGYRPRYNQDGNGGYSNNRQQNGGGYRPRYNNNQGGGYSPRPQYRRDGYDAHAKYSQKKRLEYKEENYDPTVPLRLNKFLANAGVCSRRDADKYIEAGVVTVNGQVVTELGTKVLRTDEVKFHDNPVKIEKKVYVLLNKPKGYVTTSDDPQNRKTVMDLVQNACPERIYPVGRLDRNTTGVLLLTNDGELASKLTHPKFLKKKIYHVTTDQNVSSSDLRQIAEGIMLEDGEIKADAVDFASITDKKQIGIEIHSGKNRIVRRIFESLGYHVVKLDRVYFAGLTKKNVRRGDWRYLTEKEVQMLRMGAFE